MIPLINVLRVSNVQLFLPQTALFDVESSTQTQIQISSVLQEFNEERVGHLGDLLNLHLHLHLHLQKAVQAARAHQAARAQVPQVTYVTGLLFLERLTEAVLLVLHPVLQCIGVHITGGAYLWHITVIEIFTVMMII